MRDETASCAGTANLNLLSLGTGSEPVPGHTYAVAKCQSLGTKGDAPGKHGAALGTVRPHLGHLTFLTYRTLAVILDLFYSHGGFKKTFLFLS